MERIPVAVRGEKLIDDRGVEPAVLFPVSQQLVNQLFQLQCFRMLFSQEFLTFPFKPR